MGLEKKVLDLNVFTGEFDIITLDNHSYEEIPVNRTGKIQAKQQMIVHDDHFLEGSLILDGSLILEV